MKFNANQAKPSFGFAVLTGLLLVFSSATVFGQNKAVHKFKKAKSFVTESLVFSGPTRALYEKSGVSSSEDLRQRRPRQQRVPTQFEIVSQPGVKIFVNRDAWYRVSAAQLTGAGFDVNSDRTRWRLVANGEETPIKVNADGSFEFYGRGVDTPVTDATVYYLVTTRSEGLRITELNNGNPGQNADAEFFQVRAERKDRTLYSTKILNGEEENWYGPVINSTGASLDIDLDNLSATGQASLEVRLQGATYTNHVVSVRINGYDLGMADFDNMAHHTQTFDVPLTELSEGVNQVTLQAFGAGNDVSFLDAVSLSFPRSYRAMDNRLHFSVPAGQTARVSGFTDSSIKIFEISDGQEQRQLMVDQEAEGQTYGFRLAASNYEREFVAVTDTSPETPERVEANIPSALHKRSNQAEFVIIAPASLAAPAQRLADRRNAQGLETKVVLAENVADAFGYGAATPEAVKNFLEYAGSFWKVTPGYVLLFGDASYDMRNYLGGENRNLVPTKLIETFDMETSSDGWMVDFDLDGVENLSIGRIPAADADEADRAVDKIIRYETDTTVYPKSAVLVADNYFEILNGALQDLLPADVASEKINRWEISDTEMRQQIMDNVNQNPMFVSYLGHGTTGAWVSGNIFTSAQARSLTNQKLSFYMLMTCLNGYMHHASYSSLAENLVMADNGAIAAWASSGSTYASGQIEMGQEVVRLAFAAGPPARIGDIVRTAKQLSGDWDARRTWQLIGDPTLVIR